MVIQLSVFIQNESGKIASVTRTLADNGVDIRALSIADTTDFGILRMLVSDVEVAKTALKEQRCVVSETTVIVVAVPDVPGGLANVLELLSQSQIDIEYMYSLIGREDEKAYMVFRVSDEEKLLKLLKDNNINNVTGKDLGIH